MNGMRLDKLLSNMGFGSRKECKEAIRRGCVSVDGQTASDGGMLLDPERQIVLVNGTKVKYREFVYLMLNKPAGVLSATEDAFGAPTAVELVGPEYAHYPLSPAGRLDKDSEGFLLLTNDGGFVHDIITPNRHIEKLYYCVIEGIPDPLDQNAFASGLILEDGTRCRPAGLCYGRPVLEWEREDYCDPVLLRGYPGPLAPGYTNAFVTLSEGKFHQVKRMFLARGKRVVYLKRLAIGTVWLDPGLPPGGYRELEETELAGLCRREKEIDG